MGFLVEKKSTAESLEMECFCLQYCKGTLHVFWWSRGLSPSGWFGMGVDKADGLHPLVCQVVKLKVTFVNFNKLTQRCRGTAMGKCLSMSEHMLLGFCLYTNHLYAK